jgi:hypothetical protein
MSFFAISGASSNAFLTTGFEFANIEALGRFDSDPFHLGDDRLIGEVRRLQFENFGSVGEEFSALHGINLNLWRRLHVDARIDFHLDWLRCLAPFRERRDLVSGLNFVNRFVILRTVSLGASDDPDIGSRRFYLGKSRGNGSAPAPWREKEIGRLRTLVRHPGDANTSVHMSSMGKR